MLDWDETRVFPSLPACLDPQREKHSGAREEDRPLSFPALHDFSSVSVVPSDSPSSHGDDHHLVSVPKVTVHGHLPKAGDGLDRPPCRFPLRDEHVRQYDAPPGSSITHFVRVDGVRFHMQQLSTVSDFWLRAEGRPSIPRRRPMQAICNVAVNLAVSSHSPPTFSIVRRTTLQRRQEQLVACIDLYGKKPLDYGEAQRQREAKANQKFARA